MDQVIMTPDNWVSKNVSDMSISAIKDMAIRSFGVEGVVSLAWGLPSFRTPAHIRRVTEEQLEKDPDIGKYALPDGLPELRNAVVQCHAHHTGINVDPDKNVMVTCGNMQGLNSLFHVLIDAGDEIIVTDPGFASHFQQIRMCGGASVFWPLLESGEWALDLDALPDLITERTKAILLVTPSNPTGRIFAENELRRIGKIALQKNLLVILDDPYHHYTYENASHYFNLSCVADLQDNIAYLFTFSKTYAMSGWRLGYMILPNGLKENVLKVHDATIICTPRISQVAGLAALHGEKGHLSEFEAILSKRRTLICERLDAVSHVFDYVKPEGAYYVFPRILVPHEDSVDFSLNLLDKAKVTVTPGSAFGPTGEHHVRMAFCIENDAINEAFDRIERYFPG